MAVGITMHGNSTHLVQEFFPPIILDPESSYGVKLLSLATWNNFANVTQVDEFYFQEFEKGITIPPGSYTLADLFEKIKHGVDLLKKRFLAGTLPPTCNKRSLEESDFVLKERLDSVTGRVFLFSGLTIDFSRSKTLPSLLGFSNHVLEPRTWHGAPHPANIDGYLTICLDLSIAYGAFVNGKVTNVILSFNPEVDRGYKLIYVPQGETFYKLNTHKITQIEIKLTSETGELLNNQHEPVTVCLQIEKIPD